MVVIQNDDDESDAASSTKVLLKSTNQNESPTPESISINQKPVYHQPYRGRPVANSRFQKRINFPSVSILEEKKASAVKESDNKKKMVMKGSLKAKPYVVIKTLPQYRSEVESNLSNASVQFEELNLKNGNLVGKSIQIAPTVKKPTNEIRDWSNAKIVKPNKTVERFQPYQAAQAVDPADTFYM